VNKIAKIYDNNQSPSPNLRLKNYSSVDRNSAIYLSNVKLPSVHNKSIVSGSVDPIEYLPYEEKNYINGNPLLVNKIKQKNFNIGSLGLREQPYLQN
jgi:hypothetical protein